MVGFLSGTVNLPVRCAQPRRRLDHGARGALRMGELYHRRMSSTFPPLALTYARDFSSAALMSSVLTML